MKTPRLVTQLPWENALEFILAGKAVFTIRSKETGVRYTYRVRKAPNENPEKKADLWWVSVLTGPDNNSSYTYIGKLSEEWSTLQFGLTDASKMKRDSQPVVAISWLIKRLVAKKDLNGVEIWHAGHCGRCGKTLTVPESIESGYGPECIQHVGGTKTAPHCWNCGAEKKFQSGLCGACGRFEAGGSYPQPKLIDPVTPNLPEYVPQCSQCHQADADQGDTLCFNCRWAEHKKEFAEFEDQQEAAAFMRELKAGE